MRRSHIRIALVTGLAAALVLTGCRHTGGRQEPETLLTADSSAMGDGEVDPMAAHLAARAQVDPKDTRSFHSYTTKPTAAEINSDTTVRVVRLEERREDGRNGPGKDFKNLMPDISEESAEAIGMTAPAPTPAHKPAAIIQTAAAPLPPARPEAIMPAAGHAASTVTGVRIGQHPDRTRIVLDVTAPVPFSSAIDNHARTLTVTLPQSAWTAAAGRALAGSPVVSGYSAAPAGGGGVNLAISLKRPAKLTLSTAMPPNEVYGHRIVFDVAPL